MSEALRKLIRVAPVSGVYPKFKDGDLVVNVTSRARDKVHRSFSPFFLGPVDLYWGLTSKNMENSWQFSKAYPEHVVMGRSRDSSRGEEDYVVTERYFEWALKGFQDTWAHRHPMGREKPLFSFWAGEHLGYIAARKQIYAPLYKQGVLKNRFWPYLRDIVAEHAGDGSTVYLLDFDAYDTDASFEEVIEDPTKRMGHAFVLRAMLTGEY